VDCQLDVLKRCLKVSLIREALKNLPKTLDDTYSRVLMSIEEVYRDDAKNALMWLAFSERPLQLKELAEAMVINPSSDLAFNLEDRYPNPKNVLEILSSLVTVTAVEYISDFEAWYSSSEPATVTLAHFSVKEYLVSNRIMRSSVLHFAVSDSISHSHIAKCCLYYLLQYATSPLKSNSRADLDAFPLLYYAARYWYIHTNLLQDEEQKLLTPLVLELLLPPCALSGWLQVHGPQAAHIQAFTKSDFEEVTTLPVLYYASDMGLFHVVQDLLDRGLDPNSREGHDETPLHFAAVRGHETVAQLLLKTGANIDTRTTLGSTPLHSAVEGGHVGIVQMLLSHGADVNVEDNRGWMPIHMAALDGLREIVLILLEHGALVNATNNFDQTPFHWAAWSENAKMVDLLLQKGADIDAMNGNGETALHYAASCNLLMLKHLLDKGASVDVQTLCGQTPLDWAASCERKEAVELLLTAGATVGLTTATPRRKPILDMADVVNKHSVFNLW
jgi:ankyrin repeat protein